MKISSVLLLLLLFSVTSVSQETTPDLKVGSYNVRWASPEDGVNIWENRKDWVSESIRFFDIDLLGGQEVTYGQLEDLKELLPEYRVIGEGRDGGQKGEYSPIFYTADRFEVLESDTFWLSEHPDEVASKGWDAALSRIVTWAKFRDRSSGKEFFFFNTHFDHVGKMARKNSAKLIGQKIDEIAGSSPVILTGDLNTAPGSDPYESLLEFELQDVYQELPEERIYGPEYTFNGWQTDTENLENRIDYVFYKGGLSPMKYHVLDGQRGKRFISDHFPVFVSFQWKD